MGCVRVFALRLLPSACVIFTSLLCGCVLACCVACGGGSGQPAPPDSAPPMALDSFPAPATLRQVSYDPARLVCGGGDFITAAGFPCQRVLANYDCGEFDPDWTPAAPEFADLAFACYAFDMADYDRAQQICFSWEQQGDPGDMWIGLADFERNCWAWYVLPESNILAVDFADHIDPATKQMLVLPVAMGVWSWDLNRIHVGDLTSLHGFVFMDDGMTPLQEADVVLTGVKNYAVTTDLDGEWQLDGVIPGEYEIVPHYIGWSFDPASRLVTVDGLQQQVDNFTGTQLPGHSVSGSIADELSNPISGVEMKITRQGSAYGGVSTWSQFDGTWDIDLPDGDYTVTPELVAWSFSPQSRDFSVAGGSVAVDPFVGAKLPGYLMDGYIYPAAGSPQLPEVQVTISHTELDLWYYATTDLDGYWFVPDAIDGEYTVVPQLYGWRFTPADQTVTVAGGPCRVPPFTAEELGRYIVDGYVYLDDGITPLAGIRVELLGDYGWYATTTNSLGRYLFLDVYEGEYTLLPTELGYQFTPEQREVVVDNHITADPFLATLLPRYTVDGHVYLPDGVTGVEGVLVEIYAYIPPGTSFVDYTDADGYYQIPGIPSGWYTVWPQKQGYTFEPQDRSITVEDADLTVEDFLGGPLPHYMMSGDVFELDGTTPVPGVKMAVTGWSYFYEATTDLTGHWQLDEVFEDSYTVMPNLAPWQFTPASREVVISGGDEVVDPFLGEKLEGWLVDGYIYEADTSLPVPDVEVWFYGVSLNYSCTSDASGHYELPLPAGFWNVWPSSDCWTFEPPTQSLSVSGEPKTLDVFYATPGG